MGEGLGGYATVTCERGRGLRFKYTQHCAFWNIKERLHDSSICDIITVYVTLQYVIKTMYDTEVHT